MRAWALVLAMVLSVSVVVVVGGESGLAGDAERSTVGFVDPGSGEWHLRGTDGWVRSFYFGDPGDFPMVGDWDCDGIDTPGLYRQSDGYVYLRNSNTQGIADVRFFFGNPGDIPLAGDFDGDGCDSVSVYRPSRGRVFVINELADKDQGLGAAEFDYYFGNPGDQPFVGDFDGDGIDTIGLHRATTGFVYYRNTHTQGIADTSFYFGDPGDRFVAGDWIGNGFDSPGVFRPSDRVFFYRYANTQGNADAQARLGGPDWLPVAGTFGFTDRTIDERTWSIETVDGHGNPGRFNDIAIGNDGLPLISYGFPQGLAWHELRVAHCLDASCTRAQISPIFGAMFESTAIAVPPEGPPTIVFHDVSDGQDISAAYCSDDACTSAEVEGVVADSWSGSGKYVEAGVATTGQVVMSVVDGNAVLAFVVTGVRGSWTQQRLGDTPGDHFRPSMTIGADDRAHIAYPGRWTYAEEELGTYTTQTYPTILATCSDPTCIFSDIAFKTVHTEVSEGTGGRGLDRYDVHTSVTEMAGERPAVAVSWRSGPGLDIATCQDPTCDTASTTRIDPSADAGRWVDLKTTANGTPIMAYTTPSGVVKIAHCLDTQCDTFTIATVVAPSSSGTELSLTIDWTGTPIIAYYDRSEGALVVARLQ